VDGGIKAMSLCSLFSGGKLVKRHLFKRSGYDHEFVIAPTTAYDHCTNKKAYTASAQLPGD